MKIMQNKQNMQNMYLCYLLPAKKSSFFSPSSKGGSAPSTLCICPMVEHEIIVSAGHSPAVSSSQCEFFLGMGGRKTHTFILAMCQE
jgi:hypothetical protein